MYLLRVRQRWHLLPELASTFYPAYIRVIPLKWQARDMK